MIHNRSFVPMNPDKKEINELEHSPFDFIANEGNIHSYAASLIPSHWHRELEIFILLEGRVRIGAGSEPSRWFPEKAALSTREFSIPSPASCLPPAVTVPSSSTRGSSPARREAFLTPATSVPFWKMAPLI